MFALIASFASIAMIALIASFASIAMIALIASIASIASIAPITRVAYTILPAAFAALVEGAAARAGTDRGAALPVVTEAHGRPIVALRAAGPPRIFIPASTFTMGSRADEIEFAIELCKKEARGDESCDKQFANELEAHEVTLSPYYIDRTEVTVAEYRRCVALGRCTAPPYAAGGQRFDNPDYPVTLVSWNDADSYCRFVGSRLPTEAEWERAARGTAGRKFPWGNLFNKALCNHGALALDDTDDSDGFAELAPVGSFPLGRTPDGIDDMAGNVEEWVADAIDDVTHYPAASEINPRGATTGALRVIRGGGYQAGAAWLRGAARTFHLGSDRRSYRGFRCVHPVSEGL
jgi:formylglycine-generating enzyme required for sulfatase activity